MSKEVEKTVGELKPGDRFRVIPNGEIYIMSNVTDISGDLRGYNADGCLAITGWGKGEIVYHIIDDATDTDDTITLTLSRDEAETLRNVCRLIEGCPETSRRKHTQAIGERLDAQGVVSITDKSQGCGWIRYDDNTLPKPAPEELAQCRGADLKPGDRFRSAPFTTSDVWMKIKSCGSVSLRDGCYDPFMPRGDQSYYRDDILREHGL